MKRETKYRWEASSIEAFVQQLASRYVPTGHFFYVTGIVPPSKDPHAVDAKLLDKYGIQLSKWARARRKRAGLASVQYIRFERFFAILATHGTSRFFEEEARAVRDLRRCPLKFASYAISFRDRPGPGRGHAHVRIDEETFKDLKAYILEVACRCPTEALARMFSTLPFEPYAPVRRQLFQILRGVNRSRRVAGLEVIPYSALRLRRRIVPVFRSASSIEDSREMV